MDFYRIISLGSKWVSIKTCSITVHSNKILTIQQGYPWGVSSIGKPRPTSTGIGLPNVPEYAEIGQSKQTKQKVSDFGIPPSVKGRDCKAGFALLLGSMLPFTQNSSEYTCCPYLSNKDLLDRTTMVYILIGRPLGLQLESILH